MSRISEALRKIVQHRANFRCEYCLLPDTMSLNGFHIDHIIALKHRGQDTFDNLAWACPQCNISKGSDIASYNPETQELLPLYNPRSQHWEDHFEMVDAIILAKTSIGQITIWLLQLNNPELVDTRRLLIELGLW